MSRAMVSSALMANPLVPRAPRTAWGLGLGAGVLGATFVALRYALRPPTKYRVPNIQVIPGVDVLAGLEAPDAMIQAIEQELAAENRLLKAG